MSKNTAAIIEKWYHRLGFDPKWDVDFYAYLKEIPISEDTAIEDYDVSCEDGRKNLMAYLYMCEALERKYNEMGISREIFDDTVKDLVIWSDVWSELKNQLWIGEIGWLKNHLSAELFKLGRLQFAIQYFEEDCPDYGIKKGECNIGIHIAALGPLTPESCKASLVQANAFFAKYFPEISYDYYTCHSWLLDDTLKQLLPETSNILHFADMFKKISADPSEDIFKYVFRWDTRRHNLAEANAPTSFAQRVKDFALKGNEFYIVTGIREK